MRKCVTILALLAAVLLLSGNGPALKAPTAHAAFPGGNGKIAFYTVDGNIATVASSGSNLQTFGAGYFPAWSADGSRIAFYRQMSNPNQFDIFAMNGDGSGETNITDSATTVEYQPAWSPDGSQIAFQTNHATPGSEIWIMNANGSGQHALTHSPAVEIGNTSIAWSPDGSHILFNASGPGGGNDLFTINPDGSGLTNITNTPGQQAAANEAGADWSPDGTRIAFVTGDINIVVMSANGTGRHNLTSDSSGGIPSWSPDGSKIVYSHSSVLFTMNSDGSNNVSLEVPGANPDWQPNPTPVVFIHGFLGSRIDCGSSELWPNINLFPIVTQPDFPQMALDVDGVSPAPDACTATVGDTLDTVAGSSIYKSAIDYLNGLESGNVFFFNWDWRTAPQQSLAGLDSFIDNIRTHHGNQKVVIMAHSYGGLLARLYVDDTTRAGKVARVLTVGTPAWGSPKALFPLFAGIETPDFSILDAFMDNNDLHQFAENLWGAYYLYPSASYGPWLTVQPSTVPADRQGLLNFVMQLGGNAALLDQALSTHASTLDSFAPNGVTFEAIVGTGLPTISAVQVQANNKLRIDYETGDGTVPAKSAARGPVGSTNPNAAHTHYACGVGHVDLPGDPQITHAIGSYLLSGGPIEGLDSPCPANGLQFRLFHLSNFAPSAATVAGSGTALSIQDAQLQGQIDYLDLPNEKFIITGTQFPEVALSQGKFLEVTPLSDGTKGTPVIYGPLEGQITISAGADGAAVLVDGEPAQLDGDVNCDGQVTALDALLLVLDAAGTPRSQSAGCTTIGSGADPFGDIDCDHSVTAEDGLAVLRIAAGVSLASLAGCESGGA